MSSYTWSPVTVDLGASGVASLNSLAGALTLTAGTGISITPSGGDTLIVAATGSAGANMALSNLASVAINTDLIFDAGGTATIQTKDATGVATEDLQLRTGAVMGAFKSGALTFITGASDAADSGSVNLGSGEAAGSFGSGNVNIFSGAATAINIDSGDISLTIGSVSGTGEQGQIKFVDGSEGTAGHVWTSTGTDGAGAWAAGSGQTTYTGNGSFEKTDLSGSLAAIPFTLVRIGDIVVMTIVNFYSDPVPVGKLAYGKFTIPVGFRPVNLALNTTDFSLVVDGASNRAVAGVTPEGLMQMFKDATGNSSYSSSTTWLATESLYINGVSMTWLAI